MSEEVEQVSKAVALWEVVTAAPALVLAGTVVIQRAFLFDRAEGGLLDQDIASLLVILAVLSAVVLATRPWVVRSRFGSELRMASLAVSVWSMMFLVLCTVPWCRYKIIRFETLTYYLKLSAYEGLTGYAMARNIQSPEVGPYILRDHKLMHAIASEYGRELLGSPRSARLLYGGLSRTGAGFDALFSDSTNDALLLGAVMSLAASKPWFDLEWARAIFVEGDVDGSAISSRDAARLVARLAERMEDLSFPEAEGLVFSALSIPRLVSLDARERILVDWTKRFKILEAVAVEGLIMREEVKAFLGDATIRRVSLDIQGLSESIYRDKIRAHTIPQAVLTLLRSCGHDPVLSTPDEADLVLEVALTSIPYTEYERPVYRMETFYRTVTEIGVTRHQPRSYQVAKQRNVQVGVETATAYAPMIELSLVRGGERLVLSPTLLYWYHFTFDKETERFISAGEESQAGRMWPFGIRENLYESPRLFVEL